MNNRNIDLKQFFASSSSNDSNLARILNLIRFKVVNNLPFLPFSNELSLDLFHYCNSLNATSLNVMYQLIIHFFRSS